MKLLFDTESWPIWVKTLGLTLFVALVALAAATWMGTTVLRDSLISQQHQRNLGSSRHVAQRIDSLLQQHLREVTLLAADSEVREATSTRRSNGVAVTHLRVLDDLQEYSGGVYVMDRQGQVILSTTDNVEQNFASRPYFQRALQGETYASDVSVSLDMGRPVLYFSTPVKDGKEDIVGVAVLRILAEALWDALDEEAREIGLGPASVVLVVDEYGLRLAQSTDRSLIPGASAPLPPEVERQLLAERRWGAQETVEATVPPDLVEGIRQAKAEPLFTHRLVTSPETYHAAATVLRSKPWTVLVSIPEAEFMRPVTSGAWGLATILGLATFLIFAAATYLFSRSLVQPLGQLTGSARRISRGDLETAIRVDRRDELGTLAQTMEEMRRNIVRMVSELEEAQSETIEMLARAAEAKDEMTGAHLLRIHDYVRALAQKLGLSLAEAEAMARDSVLHDVGKLHIPDDILGKPGGLTEEEWVVMRQHPAGGEKILGSGPRFTLAREIARAHHERWYGSGYPEGLRGEEIPLSARMTAVADVFDALTSERPYRRAWSPQEALEELLAQKGKNLDPTVVDAFVALWEDGTIQRILLQHGSSSADADQPLEVS